MYYTSSLDIGERPVYLCREGDGFSRKAYGKFGPYGLCLWDARLEGGGVEEGWGRGGGGGTK